jgi:hypothetical protein
VKHPEEEEEEEEEGIGISTWYIFHGKCFSCCVKYLKRW